MWEVGSWLHFLLSMFRSESTSKDYKEEGPKASIEAAVISLAIRLKT